MHVIKPFLDVLLQDRDVSLKQLVLFIKQKLSVKQPKPRVLGILVLGVVLHVDLSNALMPQRKQISYVTHS